MDTKLMLRTQVDFVSLVAILTSAPAVIVGVSLSLARPVILQKLIIPFAVSVYSDDGVISQAGIEQLDGLLRMMAPVSLAVAAPKT